MARKKVSQVKKDEEKSKPLDRTQIYVAIIGLTGTIAVALIALLGNKPPEIQAENTAPATSPAIIRQDLGTSTTGTSQVSNLQSSGGCVGEYFANVAPENQISMEIGANVRIPANDRSENTLGPFGIQLTENGVFIGALQFLGFVNSASFKVTSVVDANCTQTSDFGNLDIPSKQASIDNWGNLGLQFPGGSYRIRMGFFGVEIELLFGKIE